MVLVTLQSATFRRFIKAAKPALFSLLGICNIVFFLAASLPELMRQSWAEDTFAMFFIGSLFAVTCSVVVTAMLSRGGPWRSFAIGVIVALPAIGLVLAYEISSDRFSTGDGLPLGTRLATIQLSGLACVLYAALLPVSRSRRDRARIAVESTSGSNRSNRSRTPNKDRKTV